MYKVIIDTETTGLNVDTCKCIQVAYIIYDTLSKSIVKTYNAFLLHPGLDVMPESAFNVHKISADYLKQNGKPFIDVADEIFPDIQKGILIGHNILRYDYYVLDRLLYTSFYPLSKKRGTDGRNHSLEAYDILDTLAESKNKFPGGRHSLGEMINRLKIPIPVIDITTSSFFPGYDAKTRGAHDARWDVCATYFLAEKVGVL